MSRKAGRGDEAVPLTAGGTRSDVDLAAESGHTNQGATPRRIESEVSPNVLIFCVAKLHALFVDPPLRISTT